MFFGVTKFNDNPDFVEIAIFSQEKPTPVGRRLFFLRFAVEASRTEKKDLRRQALFPIPVYAAGQLALIWPEAVTAGSSWPP